jgi:2,4-dienoyl-CoA reductase (NADPH2)
VIARAFVVGSTDVVSLGRTLFAKPDLPNVFAEGLDKAPEPCTYCYKCLFNFVVNPLGCYEESRYRSRDEMIRHIMSVYEGAPLPAEVE